MGTVRTLMGFVLCWLIADQAGRLLGSLVWDLAFLVWRAKLAGPGRSFPISDALPATVFAALFATVATVWFRGSSFWPGVRRHTLDVGPARHPLEDRAPRTPEDSGLGQRAHLGRAVTCLSLWGAFLDVSYATSFCTEPGWIGCFPASGAPLLVRETVVAAIAAAVAIVASLAAGSRAASRNLKDPACIAAAIVAALACAANAHWLVQGYGRLIHRLDTLPALITLGGLLLGLLLIFAGRERSSRSSAGAGRARSARVTLQASQQPGRASDRLVLKRPL
ncbi:MAG: hypothetical protein IT307_18055 [Chloroflexi bacterium]|nr:hypothetical protein [Chloroflexota bacterium]